MTKLSKQSCFDCGSLKIYGASTIGSKGQIVIPKEAREDLKIKVGQTWILISINNDFRGIVDSQLDDKIVNHLQSKQKTIEIVGTTKIGSKFQFVIPSNIREQFDINPGEALLVVSKANNGLGFIKNTDIHNLIHYLQKELSEGT